MARGVPSKLDQKAADAPSHVRRGLGPLFADGGRGVPATSGGGRGGGTGMGPGRQHQGRRGEDRQAAPGAPAPRPAGEGSGTRPGARGPKAAYDFIDACYKTHSLAEEYGPAFEACIAQDYLETKVLTQVFARLPPDTLAKLGAPTPAALAQAMGRRIVAAFSQYKKPAAYGEALKKLIDEHGLAVFIGIVFPSAAPAGGGRRAPGGAGPSRIRSGGTWQIQNPQATTSA